MTGSVASSMNIRRSHKVARVSGPHTLIWNTLDDYGVSNARSEATNIHLRKLINRAYGFRSAAALIAMATLTRGGLCPELPGR